MTTTIAEYSATEAALAELREKYGKAYEVTTTAGMVEAKKARAEIRAKRSELEDKRAELKKPILERGKAIDSEARRIETELLKLEDPIDTAIKKEETRKEAAKAKEDHDRQQRASRAREISSRFYAFPSSLIGSTSQKIAEERDRLAGFDAKIDQVEGETHAADVEAARAEAIMQLDKLHAVTLAQEESQAKIADERAKLAAEQKLVADLRKADEDAAAAETKRRADEVAKLRAAAEAEQQTAREKIAAEERASEQRRKEADTKAAAERERLAREQQARLDAEMAKLAAERKATDAKAQREREAAEAKERADREVIETKRRDEERAELRRMDGYGMLMAFVDRFGADAEFKPIATTIAAWCKDAPKKKGKVA